MKLILIVEDTPQGISARAIYKPNDLSDNLEQSLAAKVVANWAEELRRMNQRGLIHIEKE